MLQRLKALGKQVKQELKVYRLVLKDARTPFLAKMLLGLALGYAMLPFDLIPDWIPVLGVVDDVIIVPVLVMFALKITPKEVVDEHRQKVNEMRMEERNENT